MRLIISRASLSRVLASVSRVVEARNTIPILSSVMLTAAGSGLSVMATDLDIIATAGAEADVVQDGAVCVDAKLLGDIAKKAGDGTVTLSLDGDKLTVKSGRSRFSLATLTAADFPSFGESKFTASFDLDIASLFAPVSFAISTEETRYYLQGVFLKGGLSEAVATDGHRLARNRGPELPDFAGIIVPRKVVGILPKGVVRVHVSDTKIRIESDEINITSKLIDGTFPDYERVIPKNNDKIVIVDRDAIKTAAERVVTVSSEKARSVKLSITPGSVSLAARSDVGTAEDEVSADYSGEPFDVGFNSRYLAEMLAVLPAGQVMLKAVDGGSPALLTGGLDGWEGVLMPMRV